MRNMLLAHFVVMLLLSISPSFAMDLITPTPPRVIQSSPEQTVDPTAKSDRPIRTIISGESVAKIDVTGKGAVLCTWSLLVMAAHAVQECGWAPTPADEAIKKAIADIDAFIIRNSPTPVTQEQLETQKAHDADNAFETAELRAGMCAHDPQSDTIGSMFWSFHVSDPDQVTAGTKEMLSVPREPVMNPCL